jgi:hypothetical protein
MVLSRLERQTRARQDHAGSRGEHVREHTVAPSSSCGSVLPTVQFDDQAEFQTGGVREVTGYRMLAPESQAAKAATTQVPPIPAAR